MKFFVNVLDKNDDIIVITVSKIITHEMQPFQKTPSLRTSACSC